jgi:hypothetical protein
MFFQAAASNIRTKASAFGSFSLPKFSPLIRITSTMKLSGELGRQAKKLIMTATRKLTALNAAHYFAVSILELICEEFSCDLPQHMNPKPVDEKSFT